MNKDKSIKDLRQRNDKLKSQYDLMQFRCCHLEYKEEKLKNAIKKIKDYIENEDISRFNNPTIEFALNIRKEELLKIINESGAISERKNN